MSYMWCRNLDYETIDGTGYRFKVIATDQGVPAKASSAYVRVQVENTNDERPQFNSISIEKIEATKTVNSVVATVLALDPDGDKVTYGIVGSKLSSVIKYIILHLSTLLLYFMYFY